MRSLMHEPRIVAGIALMLIATCAGGLLLERASQRATVWQASHALAAGTVILPTDVRLTQVAIDGAEVTYVAGSRPVVGRSLNRDLGAGELLPTLALAGALEPSVEVSVPVERSHTLEDLRRSDRVDVWWSNHPEQGQVVQSSRVLARVRVVAAAASDVGAGSSVVLAVAPEEVQPVVQALRSGVLDLARVGVPA